MEEDTALPKRAARSRSDSVRRFPTGFGRAFFPRLECRARSKPYLFSWFWGAHAPRVQWSAPSPTTRCTKTSHRSVTELRPPFRPARRRSEHARARVLPNLDCILPAKRASENSILGSTGDPPVQFGDSPAGTRATLRINNDGLAEAWPPLLPIGESPIGAGESPALPTFPARSKPAASRRSAADNFKMNCWLESSVANGWWPV